MKDLASSVRELQKFAEGSLRAKLKDVEDDLRKGDVATCADLNDQLGVGPELLQAAAAVKSASAQIDVLIHAIGILHLLPQILKPQERVEYLSLGAGSTGKDFDLETNLQIAEFTFINWKGRDAVRQSKLFVDFYHLAEASTAKERNLYVLGLHHPLSFFKGKRSLKSVLSRRPAALAGIVDAYDGMQWVREYYAHHAQAVNVIDMSPLLPKSLLAVVEAAADDDD